MKRIAKVGLGMTALIGAMPSGAIASDTERSVWFDAARSPAAPWADGLLRSASTAADLIKSEVTRPAATEDWVAARLKVTASKEWAAWVAREQRRLDSWITAQLERDDLVGGYLHDYIDAVTGIRLVWTPQTPKPPAGPDGGAAQRLERAWVAFMREYNIARMADAARMYKLTGQDFYAAWSASQMDLYADNYERWPLRTTSGRGRLFAHGLDEATNVFALVDVARLLDHYAGPQRVAKWRQDLFYPIAQNLKTITSPLTNIGLWQSAAIAAVALRYQDRPLLDYARTSPLGIESTLRHGVTRDNLWVEGSFSYNAYVLDVLDKLLVTAALEGQSTAFTQEAQLARRLLLAPLDYRFEDGSLPTPGDGTVGFQARPNWLYAKLYRSVPTWYGLRQATNVRSWDTLLDAPESPVGDLMPLPPVMTRHFSANRMAVLKAGPWQAFVRYGQTVANHAQADALAYELADGATKLSSNVGTASYAAKQHLDYFTQAASHNVPLIDGQGQADIPAAANVVRFAAAENSLQVSFPGYRPGVTVERAWRVADRGFVERTRIVMQPPAGAARLGLAFHTTCNVVAGALQKSSSAIGPPPTKATKFWTDVQEYSVGKQWRVALLCTGNRGYDLVVNGPPEQRVIVASAPSTPLPAMRTVIYFDTKASTAEFELSVGRLGPVAN